MTYLGIDLGTSGVKAVLLSEDDKIIDSATSSLSVHRPKPLWSEQNPNDWWDACNCAVLEIKSRSKDQLAGCKAIGLSGQMHGATLLDKKHQVLRPAILWNDGRSSEECKEFEERVNSRAISGNIAMPGFTAPKLSWLRKHEPEVFSMVHKVLLPKDYVRFLMTNEFASDVSDSAGTLWLDVAKRSWSPSLLSACELDVTQMPTLFEGTEITGYLTPAVAKLWGIQEIPVAGGGGDNAAGAIGAGVIKTGSAFLSLGTSGVYFVVSDHYTPSYKNAVHTFCHCVPGTWHHMSVILSAASCLSWATKLLGLESEALLLDRVRQVDFSKPSNLLFLPYLSGERTPHNDPFAKGVFFGLDHNTSAADIGRAVLEGVAFAFVDGQEALQSSAIAIEEVTVIGGGARSQLWGQVLSNVLGRELIYRKDSDLGPAFGAARLGRIASADIDPLVACEPGEIEKVISPDASQHELYQEKIENYRKLYRVCRELYS